MSIRPCVRYDSASDSVHGFENLGNHKEPGNEVANLLFVVVLRGLRRPWKQPIAYYLASHSITPDILQRILMDILRQVHEAGIEVREQKSYQA